MRSWRVLAVAGWFTIGVFHFSFANDKVAIFPYSRVGELIMTEYPERPTVFPLNTPALKSIEQRRQRLGYSDSPFDLAVYNYVYDLEMAIRLFGESRHRLPTSQEMNVLLRSFRAYNPLWQRPVKLWAPQMSLYDDAQLRAGDIAYRRNAAGDSCWVIPYSMTGQASSVFIFDLETWHE